VIQSAFLSAGQRCSALRVLYLQRDIADHVLTMLSGAMQELKLGWPGRLETDIGPVIDSAQLEMLEKHAQEMERSARLIARVPLPPQLPEGFWFEPRAFEIGSID
ncbi:MAG: aldehyde dehydrogenase family protein, partial [Wenzhouxiangellaceae bacterium]